MYDRSSEAMNFFHRCSLEHAKQVEEKRQSHRHPPLLKISSASAPTPASDKKKVAFSDTVRVKRIPFRDEAYFQAAWLSKQEQADIQSEAKADIKTVKQLTKNSYLMKEKPEVRHLNLSISLRGLEPFSSRRMHQRLLQEQFNVICSVLDVQDVINDSMMNTLIDKEERIAQVSAGGSHQARERAIARGIEDEAAIKQCLVQERSKSMAYYMYMCSAARTQHHQGTNFKPIVGRRSSSFVEVDNPATQGTQAKDPVLGLQFN